MHTDRERLTRRLALGLLVVGAWGTLAPYAGPEVPVAADVEIIDHVVPGVMILTVSALALRRRMFALAPAAVSLLAAFWMVVTHVPLLAQAGRGEGPWDGALWMFVPGGVLMLLTGWALAIAFEFEFAD